MNSSPLVSSNAVGGRPSTGGVSPLSLINPNPDVGALDVNALQEEKKKLHAYLKSYEREFSRTHNRPVMRHEDIQPVAGEYQRYKELKALVKARKGSSTV
jgi:hypothetical protein